jgi:hypothetical protein
MTLFPYTTLFRSGLIIMVFMSKRHMSEVVQGSA